MVTNNKKADSTVVVTQQQKELIAKNFEHYMKMITAKLTNRVGYEKLVGFLEANVGEVASAPVATHIHYGGAYDGGMVEISLQTLKYAAKLNVAYEANIPADSLVVCSLLSLLGAYGTEKQSFFIWNESEWHRKNQGAIYTIEPKLANLSIPNLSLWRLNSLGFSISPEELQVIQTMGYDRSRYLTGKDNQSSTGSQDSPVSWLTLIINQAYAAACAVAKNRTEVQGFETSKPASK